ncbi:unnamed protein product [Nezara viridula]|uniref:Uncharacterized protein n=1 Tax=Nezara viridula TaxID=85310 RepID=A0A9P0MR70_NEZVI|nr:unnamed protein product [Nezara viridula]
MGERQVFPRQIKSTLLSKVSAIYKTDIELKKDRIVKPVTKKAVELLKKDLALEEENMFYLRHPFLTREQSAGHARYLQKYETRLQKYRNQRNEKFAKHRTLKNELSHLKTKEQWEFTAGSLPIYIGLEWWKAMYALFAKRTRCTTCNSQYAPLCQISAIILMGSAQTQAMESWWNCIGLTGAKWSNIQRQR